MGKIYSLLLGFDAFDPRTFERLREAGKMQNLARLAEKGSYAHFGVSTPPQTEVSWTSIATGQNPGNHGIFDFVQRIPAHYTPYPSLLPTQQSLTGINFTPPFKARTIFEEATRHGYAATALWWPATFPARPELPVRTIPGLGTPDILGKLGVGTLLCSDAAPLEQLKKVQGIRLHPTGKGRYTATLPGMQIKRRNGVQTLTCALNLEVDDADGARVTIGEERLSLQLGKWSPIIQLTFRAGRFFSFRAISQAILTSISPHISLYLLPLQIHPLHAPWHYATPPGFVRNIWKGIGPYLTLGWPQDTTALEEGCITDEQFLSLCTSIFASREKIFMRQLDTFREGLLGIVFDSLDRVQHMFRRDHPEVIELWYERLDALVGRVLERLNAMDHKSAPQLLVLSDHGFSDFDYKVHLNRWLIQNGVLRVNAEKPSGGLNDVDWSQSLAYAVGLNSIYINLRHREGRGIVSQEEYDRYREQLRGQLTAWRGMDGKAVVQEVWLKEEIYHGAYLEFAPDLVLGYAPGYRASAETGLGQWRETALEPNRDHWGADHCIHPQEVPGVFFCNRKLAHLTSPSYVDIPPLVVGRELEIEERPPTPRVSAEEREVLEERLKGLGYL